NSEHATSTVEVLRRPMRRSSHLVLVVTDDRARELPFERNPEDLPHRNEERGEDRTNHEAHHAEERQAAKGGEEDEERVELRIAAHELRAHQVVHAPDNEGTERCQA